MISYQVYKLLHLVGIFVVMAGIGQLVLRKPARIAHILGLLLVLVGGFGMAARLGMVDGLPTWVQAKIAIWVLIGGLGVALWFLPKLARLALWGTVALGAVAAYIAINKPF